MVDTHNARVVQLAPQGRLAGELRQAVWRHLPNQRLDGHHLTRRRTPSGLGPRRRTQVAAHAAEDGGPAALAQAVLQLQVQVRNLILQVRISHNGQHRRAAQREWRGLLALRPLLLTGSKQHLQRARRRVASRCCSARKGVASCVVRARTDGRTASGGVGSCVGVKQTHRWSKRRAQRTPVRRGR